jgi:hypothetical protein
MPRIKRPKLHSLHLAAAFPVILAAWYIHLFTSSDNPYYGLLFTWFIVSALHLILLTERYRLRGCPGIRYMEVEYGREFIR